MRLHSNDEIATMTRERILELLNMVDGSEHTDYSTDELKEILTHNERSRSLWVWHDHSSLVSHGIIAVMIGIMYDPIVFLSESESPGIQEFVEGGEIHFVAHGTSSLSDQLSIVPERVAKLEGLSEPVRTENRIQVVDTLRFFKGDKLAAEFESGISCGGRYPCVGCVCSVSRFADFLHVANCEIRTFKSVQEIALQGVYGKKAGHLKFYEALNKRELQLELEARGIKEYPGSKNGRLDVLKDVLCGVQSTLSFVVHP